MKANIIKIASIVFSVFVLSSCSPCGEPSGQNEYRIENFSNIDVQIIRYRKNSNSIDSILLHSMNNFQEIGEVSSSFGDQNHEYISWFDSIKVVYKDSIFVTHNLENTFLLNRNILGASAWDVTDNSEKDCLNTRTFRFNLGDGTFEEAKLKGKEI